MSVLYAFNIIDTAKSRQILNTSGYFPPHLLPRKKNPPDPHHLHQIQSPYKADITSNGLITFCYTIFITYLLIYYTTIQHYNSYFLLYCCTVVYIMLHYYTSPCTISISHMLICHCFITYLY